MLICREQLEQNVAQEMQKKRERGAGLLERADTALSALVRQSSESHGSKPFADSDSTSSEEDEDRSPTPLGHTSRYSGDFKETGLLGKGGCGEVVKVRNRLDKRFYAVKKIVLDPKDKDVNRKLMREVKTISMLYHKNVSSRPFVF